MSHDLIAKAKALSEDPALSGAPWDVASDEESVLLRQGAEDMDPPIIAACFAWGGIPNFAVRAANARFIAESRTLVPALANALQEAERQLAAIRKHAQYGAVHRRDNGNAARARHEAILAILDREATP